MRDLHARRRSSLRRPRSARRRRRGSAGRRCPARRTSTCTGTLPSAGSCGAAHSGAHGELAPARVSSHALICGGSNVTLPGSAVDEPRHVQPEVLADRDAGRRRHRRVSRRGVAAAPVGADCAAARACAAATPRQVSRGFGMPSSLTSVTSVTGSPDLHGSRLELFDSARPAACSPALRGCSCRRRARRSPTPSPRRRRRSRGGASRRPSRSCRAW